MKGFKMRFVAVVMTFSMVMTAVVNMAVISMADSATVFSVEDAECSPGDTVELTLSMDSGVPLTSVGLVVETDENDFKLEGFGSYGEIVTNSMLGSMAFDAEKKVILFAYQAPTVLKGNICSVFVKVSSSVPAGSYSIKFTATTKNGSTAVTSNDPVAIIRVAPKANIPEHTHSLKHVEKTPSTCSRMGNAEYFICTVCGKMFSDSAATHEVKDIGLPFDTSVHSGPIVKRNVTDNSGNVVGEVSVCESCGAIVTDSWANPFSDVSSDAPYYDDVKFVYQNNIFKGVSKTRFAPDSTMTRAMFVTVLGRIEKVDENDYNLFSFSDVPLGQWYSAYVRWANDFSIVNGYNRDRFGPNDDVTVEQAVAIIARYTRFKGISTESRYDFAGYTGSGSISEWALEDMRWAVENGIYDPADGVIAASALATRSLIAGMLHSLLTMPGFGY